MSAAETLTAEALSSKNVKDLAQLAKRRGINGWRSMRKDELVKALVRQARVEAARNGHANGKNGHSPKSSSRRIAVVRAVPAKNGHHPAQPKKRNPQSLRKLAEAKAKLARDKDLAHSSAGDANGAIKDRLVVMVRGPYWLHAWWQLSRTSVTRAQAALGQEWHAARPVLRLYEVSVGTTTTSAERPLRDIEVHGGVNDWYIDLKDPPKSHRLDIGYLAPSGKFFVLARSNTVTTPKAGASDSIDENWSEVAENFDKIYAMSGGYESHAAGDLQELFEERLRRPMGSPMITQYGAGIEGLLPKKRGFHFEVDAELLVFGSTDPDAHVTLQGEPVKLRPDGTFTMRFSLPNCRQVIPAVAASRDGFEQRTVVLAVERNTKVMEPLLRDTSNE
ncbi:MAG TPA: DUF4912 domain-containing protein [Pirellulales bacterium]|nr:DUF4912 domain-containing protein [Pirellulales bacterium]